MLTAQRSFSETLADMIKLLLLLDSHKSPMLHGNLKILLIYVRLRIIVGNSTEWYIKLQALVRVEEIKCKVAVAWLIRLIYTAVASRQRHADNHNNLKTLTLDSDLTEWLVLSTCYPVQRILNFSTLSSVHR